MKTPYKSILFGITTLVLSSLNANAIENIDITTFRASNGTWYTENPLIGVTTTHHFGEVGDIPVPGNYDGPTYTDTAVFRPSNGTWYISDQNTGYGYSRAYGKKAISRFPVITTDQGIRV